MFVTPHSGAYGPKVFVIKGVTDCDVSVSIESVTVWVLPA
jgi:hypothetical protein